MRIILAILVGKIIAKLSRLFKIGGGSAAPGLLALRIDPEFVEELIKHIPKNVIITGTNGKTTTARMLAHFAKEQELGVIRNHTGSNLERGIASTLIATADPRGLIFGDPIGPNYDLGIWELDEAAFNLVAPKIKPDIIVFLNVFRDQLDRYGEVDTVIRNWCQTLKTLPKDTVVLVNGDDVNTAKLSNCFKGKVITFGVKDYKLIGEALEREKTNKNLDYEANSVVLKGIRGCHFQLTINNELLIINLPLPGLYHIYDALAAIVCAHHLHIPLNQAIKSLKNYSPAFGRVEKFNLNPRYHRTPTSEIGYGYILLIKNPAGATQVFETVAPNIGRNDRLLLALNDNIADGRDISWIWDGGFETLSSQTPRYDIHVIASGTRAHDLAVRLKYGGFDPKDIMVEADLKKALRRARKGLKGRLFILPTYTAMLGLQKILAQSGIKRHWWEE